MVTQGKYYTVMELAEQVGVPRTTINDWLNRYAPYIDFTMQGKRRIYSENTLSVLLRISQLRASGASSFQIESELAASYAVHPETADETPSPKDAAAGKEEKKPDSMPLSESPAPESTADAVTQPDDGDDETVSPAVSETALVRNPAGDPAVLLGERFREMLEKMDTMEKRTRSSARRAWFFFAFALLLTILLGAAGFFAHRLLRDMEREASEKNAELARLTDHTTNLTAGTRSLREQLETLQKGLASQEKEFRAALQENRENYEKRREAELSAQKDRFAAERLELVRQLESARRDAEAREAQLRKESEEAVQRLKQELSKQAEAEKERLLREKMDEVERMKKGEKLPDTAAVHPEDISAVRNQEKPEDTKKQDSLPQDKTGEGAAQKKPDAAAGAD